MKLIRILICLCVVMNASMSFVHSAGPSAELARDAFKQILSQADANKDGNLTQDECKGIYTNTATAEKNCAFWDVNKDGTITEDEYVSQAMSMGKKK